MVLGVVVITGVVELALGVVVITGVVELALGVVLITGVVMLGASGGNSVMTGVVLSFLGVVMISGEVGSLLGGDETSGGGEGVGGVTPEAGPVTCRTYNDK